MQIIRDHFQNFKQYGIQKARLIKALCHAKFMHFCAQMLRKESKGESNNAAPYLDKLPNFLNNGKMISTDECDVIIDPCAFGFENKKDFRSQDNLCTSRIAISNNFMTLKNVEPSLYMDRNALGETLSRLDLLFLIGRILFVYILLFL